MNIKDVNVLERLLPNQNQAKEMSHTQAENGFDKIYQNRIQKTTHNANTFPERKLERVAAKKVTVKDPEIDSRKSQKVESHKVAKTETIQKAPDDKIIEAKPNNKNMIQRKELTADNDVKEEVTTDEINSTDESSKTDEIGEPVVSPLAKFIEVLMTAVDKLEEKLQEIKTDATKGTEAVPQAIDEVFKGLEASVAKLKEALESIQTASESTSATPVSKLVAAIEALQGFNKELAEAIKTLGKEQAKDPSAVKDAHPVDATVNLKTAKVFQQLKELENTFKHAVQSPLVHLQAKPILDKLESTDGKAYKMIQNMIQESSEIRKSTVVSADLSSDVSSDPKTEEDATTKIAVKGEDADSSKKGMAFSAQLHKVEGQGSKAEAIDQRNVHLEQVGTPIDKQVVKLNEKAAENNPLFKSILNQVQDGMKASLKVMKDGSEMVMKLKPESLGEVNVKVTVHKNTVMAELQVQSQIVKEALESSLNDLRNTLKDKGFNVDQLNVSVGQDGSFESSKDQGQYSRQRSLYANPLSRDEIELPLLEKAKVFIQNGKLDYFA